MGNDNDAADVGAVEGDVDDDDDADNNKTEDDDDENCVYNALEDDFE